jgi:hypothetical protein
MYKALVSCKDIEKEHGAKRSGIFRALRHLQLLAQVYMPLLCLDRVSIRSASEAAMADESTISAHMNIMMYPVSQFVSKIRLDAQKVGGDPKEYSSTDGSSGGGFFGGKAPKQPNFTREVVLALEKAVAREMSEQKQHLAAMADVEGRSHGAKAALPVMVAEGTGFFCPDSERFDPLKRTYERVASVFDSRISRFVRQMIYRPAVRKNESFFLNVMTCSTDWFARKYNLPLCTFVPTTLEPARGVGERSVYVARSEGSGDRSRYIYGAEYLDFVRDKDSIRFVAAPSMTPEELACALQLARFKKPVPRFVLAEHATETTRGDAVVPPFSPVSRVQDVFDSETQYSVYQDFLEEERKLQRQLPRLLSGAGMVEGDVHQHHVLSERLKSREHSKIRGLVGGSSPALLSRAYPAPCEYDADLRRYVGVFAVVRDGRAVPASDLSKKQIVDIIGTYDLDAKRANMHTDNAMKLHKILAEIEEQVASRRGSNNPSRESATNHCWTVHHIHQRTFMYPNFCKLLAGALSNRDVVLDHVLAFEPLAWNLNNVVLMIKTRRSADDVAAAAASPVAVANKNPGLYY